VLDELYQTFAVHFTAMSRAGLETDHQHIFFMEQSLSAEMTADS
jgi:hypothetical protein